MMKRILPAMAIMLAVATPAFAASATGTVASIDTAGDSVTLSSGRVFHLPEGIEVETFKIGEKVHLTYDVRKGRALVSKAAAAM